MPKAGRKKGRQRPKKSGQRRKEAGLRQNGGGRVEGAQEGEFELKDRLIRYQPKMTKPRIPGGITPESFAVLTGLLHEILHDMQGAIEAEVKANPSDEYDFDFRPKELHVRLNESHKPFPLGIFVGWVESEDVQLAREAWNQAHPGLARFGDDALSEIYAEAFRYADKDDRDMHPNPIFRYREWDKVVLPPLGGAQELTEIFEKRSGEKATDPKAGNRFQTCLAIVAQGRAVGTLVVGFKKRLPDPLLNVAQQVLRDWARGFNNKRMGLLNFLNGFALGGPLLKKSDWAAQIFEDTKS
jgi:hypothetical protein